MGLFDFLKPKVQAEAKAIQPKADRPECDITKTQLLADLFQLPPEERDASWQQEFLDNVWFLPKHYIILSVPKNSSFTKNFSDL